MSKRKNPSNSDNLNEDFCEFLMELADYEKNVSRNIHKYNAYRKAAGTLALHPKRIASGIEARKLDGIGEKISKKIDEFLQTGTLKKLKTIHEDEDAQAINLLTRVSGIGPVKAAELLKMGIKTFNDLEHNKDVSGAPSLALEILMRGKETSGDIDVLVTHPSIKVKEEKKKCKERMLKDLVDSLQDFIVDTISVGDTKFMGVCRLRKDLAARRLDIRLIPREQYYCAVLYFTGSDVFNKTMRARALEMGYTLNEYSLTPIGVTGVRGEAVPISSEEEIFDYIDYPYKEPHDRNL